MKRYSRSLNLPKLLNQKSHFLFGARSTGKSTLIKDQLESARVYDLLGASDYRRLLKRPETLREELSGYEGLVVIDEVQKLPLILDEVHWILENRPNRFLLTGSSARKLKQGGANLLAGRAWLAYLFPLTSHEITDFNLLRYLNYGGLPQVYQSQDPQRELDVYIDLYLREEIKAESLTRNIGVFSEFLDLIALSNGEEINMSSLASDCGVSPTAIKSYLSILEDTQVGFTVPGLTLTRKRKGISRAKFYLFDVGVCGFIAKRGVVKEGSELFGKTLEHFIALELRAALSYHQIRANLHYWRSTSQIEVDFVIPGHMAIEVKSTTQVSSKHLKGLRALKEENLDIPHHITISLDSRPRQTSDGIQIYPVREFLKDLWSGKLWAS